MTKRRSKLIDLRQYSILLLLVFTAVSVVVVLRYHNSPKVQFQIFVALAIAYLTWSLLHHSLDKSLTLEVVIEYVLTALLALVILYGLLI